MILDAFSAPAHDFASLNPLLQTALDWAGNTDLNALPDGVVEVDGRRIYAIVASYDTSPGEEKRFEAHRAYADIQIVASGEERLFWKPVRGLPGVTAEYDAASDKILFGEPEESTPFTLRPGLFAVFYPNDGHKGGCAVNAPSRVKKITVKVLIPQGLSSRVL